MKSIIASLFLIGISLTAFGQAQTTTNAVTNNTSASQNGKATVPTKIVVYRCPECGFKSSKPGECTMDKTTLVKVGDYYCPECYMSQATPGKCPMCGVDMVQMTLVSKVK